MLSLTCRSINRATELLQCRCANRCTDLTDVPAVALTARQMLATLTGSHQHQQQLSAVDQVFASAELPPEQLSPELVAQHMKQLLHLTRPALKRGSQWVRDECTLNAV